MLFLLYSFYASLTQPMEGFMSFGSWWTEEQDAMMLKLWEAGSSATIIAQRLGTGKTRNAIMGRLNRLGKMRTRGDVNKKGNPVREPRPPKRPLVIKYRPVRPTPVAPNPNMLVAFMALREHHCRWPVGDPMDPSFRFCGEQRDSTSPYCTYHHLQSVQPPKEYP